MRACTKYFGNYHYSADWDPWRGSTRSHQELRPGGRDSLNFKCTSFLKNRSLDSEEEITVFLSCIVCLFKYSFSLYLTIVHRKGHSGNNLAQVTPRINMLFSVPLITAPSSLHSLSRCQSGVDMSLDASLPADVVVVVTLTESVGRLRACHQSLPGHRGWCRGWAQSIERYREWGVGSNNRQINDFRCQRNWKQFTLRLRM